MASPFGIRFMVRRGSIRPSRFEAFDLNAPGAVSYERGSPTYQIVRKYHAMIYMIISSRFKCQWQAVKALIR